MRIFSRLLCLAALALSSFSPAHAQVSLANAQQYLTIGAGWFDFSRNGDDTVYFSGEWRGKPFFYGFLPVIGASVNGDGGVYGYAGLNYAWEFAPRWIIAPGVVAGAWRDGSNDELGGTIEFRESLELDYALQNDWRVGAQINHMSNAGIYDHNPGANSLMGIFSLPLGN